MRKREGDFSEAPEVDKLAPAQVASEAINTWENDALLGDGNAAHSLVEAVKKSIEEERSKREPEEMVALLDAFEESVQNITAGEDDVSKQVEVSLDYLKESREEFATL